MYTQPLSDEILIMSVTFRSMLMIQYSHREVRHLMNFVLSSQALRCVLVKH